MPIIKSAKKKVRGDKKRTSVNKPYAAAYKRALRALGKGLGDKQKLLKNAFSAIDKAVKKRVIHRNKANRLKANASKLVKGTLARAKKTKEGASK